MVAITFPDGAVRQFDQTVTGMEVAVSISEGLAKKALAIKVNGEAWDLNRPITFDANVAIICRDKSDPEALEIIRHDCAHVLAEAVQELYPDAKISIGPCIENGFYYDFYRTIPFRPEDLETIEAKMAEIVDRGESFTREVWDRETAIAHFTAQEEPFKVELVRDLPVEETITIYKQGHWNDLCRGPHAPNTKYIGKAFKLQRVSGAYWRGDSNREQMQRIYGTAWENPKQLKEHLLQLEEAAKRDHRKLGREMGLFHQQEEATGSVFWHQKGWQLYRTIESYMRDRLEEAHYQEVKTPQLVDRKLWEASGHWEKFRENMFTTGDAAEEGESDPRILALKPMNCPCHVQIFNQGVKSYRDLPLRMAEFGSCMRNESSGSMHGIMRVRAFTQDDAHIFVRPDQINSETIEFCSLLTRVYNDFGFQEILVKFSDRPKVRAGSDSVWDQAESALRDAIEAAGLPYEINPGEGAFYGPKLEFVLKDAIGRDWQCGTLQVDFVLPERLGAQFMDEDGGRKQPVMLHRAILGSFERFIGILIENFEGKFPLWLAPLQVVIATITSEASAYANDIAAQMRAAGLRVITDTRNEKINYKIREHSLGKVPVIAVVGAREAAENKVALRRLGGKNQDIQDLKEAIHQLCAESTPPHKQ